MATQTIDACSVCGSWATLREDRCYQCRWAADLPRDRLLTVPISMLASGLPLQVRVLTSAGFGAARIAELLAADEADVRRVLGG